MHFELTRRADYAVRCALDLAHHAGRPRKARQISEAMAVPRSYVASIVGALVDAGIATSTAGPKGGYALARAPEEVSLLEVIEATEGTLGSQTCVLRGGPCRWEGRCAVHEPWSRAQDAMREQLAATTYDELVAADAAAS